MDTEPNVQIIVHVPESTKADLKALADREHRSLSGQIRLFIEQGLAPFGSVLRLRPSADDSAVPGSTAGAAPKSATTPV